MPLWLFRRQENNTKDKNFDQISKPIRKAYIEFEKDSDSELSELLGDDIWLMDQVTTGTSCSPAPTNGQSQPFGRALKRVKLKEIEVYGIEFSIVHSLSCLPYSRDLRV